MAEGTPEQVATVEASHTGRFLAEILAGRGSRHLAPPGEPPPPGETALTRKAPAKPRGRAKVAARR